MGLLSNRISKESLKPGDHIYSWRTAYIYALHGIYIRDGKVVHFTRRGQAISITGRPLAAVLPTPIHLVITNIYGMAATSIRVYCASRYAADIGIKRDVVKVPVEDLTRRFVTGLLHVIEPQISAAPIQVIQQLTPSKHMKILFILDLVNKWFRIMGPST